MQQPRSGLAMPSFASLVELLEIRAREEPDRLLYTFLLDGEENTATFRIGELRRRACAIAAVLQESGAMGERALLLHAPGLDYIAAFFGCLYAGVIAVPAYPPDPMRLHRTLPRLQAIVHDAQASIALTSAAMLELSGGVLAAAPDLKALRWVATDAITDERARAWRPPVVHSGSLAFLQYTSGSTNTPKGVELSHANLLHNLEQMRHVCSVTSESVLVSWLPPYHDMGLIAFILEPLYARTRGVLMSPLSFLERPLRWLQAISRYRGTACGTPSFGLELCVRRTDPQQRASLDLRSLQTIACGGEPIRADTVHRFVDAFAPCGLRKDAFQPLYGLAEATLFVSGARQDGHLTVKRVDRWALERNRAIETLDNSPNVATLVGCGRTFGVDRLIIVDPETRLRCRPRQVGEIWISSPSVAQGYWQRPEVTEQTFQACLADSGEGPFLRTGDLGFLDDDELFVTGRLKDLIILNGTNHYAEDIELTAQLSNPLLRRGCGAAFAIEDKGQERLVLVQEVDTRQAVDVDGTVADIREALSQQHQLAAHEIVLIQPGSIPKTSSGKIQRHACRAEFLQGQLSAIEAAPVASPAQPVPSAKHTHESLEASLIAEVATELGRPARDIHANVAVTRYGLDSLAVYNLAHRIESATGLRIDVGAVLDGLTIRHLAKHLLNASLPAGEQSQVGSAPPASSPLTFPPLAQGPPAPGTYALSHGQEALWFLHQLAPESSAYHLAQAARMVGPFSAAALHTAFQRLVDRHPVLRTTFPSRLGKPIQEVHAHVDVCWQEQEAQGWTLEQVEQRLYEAAYAPFDLEQGPLLRVALFHGAESGNFVVVAAHHIVADLWSLAILLRELGNLYSAACQGLEASLPPLSYHYGDYVRWQTEILSGAEGERLWSQLQQRLAHQQAVLDLPTDRPRPPLQTFRGAAYKHRLDRELTQRLHALGQAHDATLYTTLLAAFEILLRRHGAPEKMLLGSLAAGRSRPEWANVVGYFVNPMVLTADLSSDPTFLEVLTTARRCVVDALASVDYPFALLVERLHPVRDPSRSPLFQVLFALESTTSLGLPEVSAFALGEAGVRMDLGALQLESFPLRQEWAQFDLTLALADVDGALCVSWQYNTDLFEEATIARLARHFETLLHGVVDDPTQTVSTLPILSAQERHQQLNEWNATERIFDRPHCIHQLFEEQVQRTPDAVALTYGTESLTYAELERRANQLARYLNRLGVGPEVPVALCVERSFTMIIALLGILKAGGAYLPLDPDYPRERLGFMLDDAAPPLLLTHGRMLERLPDYDGTVVHLDDDWPEIARERPDAVLSGVIANNLAYILYTSGSTGRPKGVMNSHGAVCNYLLWLQDAFPLRTRDHLLQITPLSFDISVTECFWPLASGARLTLAPPGGQRDAGYLLETIRADSISVLQVVPSTLRLLLDHPTRASMNGLRLVLCGGEEMSVDLHDRFFSCLRADLYNVYGPTEASVWATYWKCHPGGAQGGIPIGKPLSNVKLRILDADLNLVPIGVPGELHIGGLGLARGYLNRPALTAERFIDDPHGGGPHHRLYKTGDLARYRPDGSVEYLGRLDHQVKIRGHRIELGEIEAVLTEHMEVRECAVVARADELGEMRLVAYVVPRWERAPEASELRSFLKGMLPEYMLPVQVVTLPALPLTANGKLDRSALPQPSRAQDRSPNVLTMPRNREEFRLSELWAEVLGVDLVGIHDDFFELGGDSLRATQLAAKMSSVLQRDVSVRFVIQHRSVAAAVEALKHIPAEVEAVTVETQPVPLPEPAGTLPRLASPPSRNEPRPLGGDYRKTGVEFRHPGKSRGPVPDGAHAAGIPALDSGFRRNDERTQSPISEKSDSLFRRDDERLASTVSEKIDRPVAEVAAATPGLVIEPRRLLTLLAAGKIPPVQAAALGYFPAALAHAGISRQHVVENWCEGLPLFSSVHETAMGRIATILLPCFSDQLYADKTALLDLLVEAVQLAAKLGAGTVSLTGLLPSATDYGRDLAPILRDRRLPQITTGHATTAATVVLAIEKILAQSRRDLRRESAAFLGLGSIGAATLTAMLELLPHPQELLLCDLATRRESLRDLAASLADRYQFRGRIQVLESQGSVPAELYQARLIIGATNVPDVLDVGRLQAGTLVVDDSAPHCFNPTLAIERLTVHRDILFSEGGILRAPQAYGQLRYVPPHVDPGLLRSFDLTDPREITGCILSSLLTATVASLTPTLGSVDGRTAAQHYRVLRDLGFEAGNLRCGAMVVPERLIEAFRNRFGA